MSALRVIRCEHPEGRRAWDGLEDIPHKDERFSDASALWWDLPTPSADCGYMMKGYEVCAAPPHKLDTWFPEWVRPLLREQGYMFVELEVPPGGLVAKGDYQVVIKRSQCRVVGEYLQ